MIPEDKLAEYDNLLEPIHSIENCFCNECCSCHIAPPCGHCVKCIDKDEHHDSVLFDNSYTFFYSLSEANEEEVEL